MLFVIALEMVFEKRTERREQRAEKVIATPEIEDVSVFPMAMPMLAGPGSIASVLLLVAQNNGFDRALVIRSEEHTSELQSLMRISYAVFCLKNNTHYKHNHPTHHYYNNAPIQ